MAVVNYSRIGTKLSGKVGESLKIDETYQIRVDDPQTSRVAIIQATPIGWFTPHPEFDLCRAMEFALSHTDRSMMLWTLEVSFYIPPKDKKYKENGLPEDYWEASGGTTTVPLFETPDGDTITNAAGDPLEGLSREREEKGWVLTKYYNDDDGWKADRDLMSGSVNNAPWDGGEPHTWKVSFKSATKKEIQLIEQVGEGGGGGGSGGEDATMLEYIETKWEFRYDPETWKCLPWDVGFMELNGSGERVTILGADGKAVKQPVALNPDGTAKTPGEKPGVILDGEGLEIYQTQSFAAVFGDPFLIEGS